MSIVIIGATRRARREMPLDIFGGGDNGAGKAADAQLQATRESNELLEKFFNQSRDDLQPWRQAGGAALNRLMQLTGLPANATTALTENQLREQLLPQFTSQNASVNPPSLRDLGWSGSYNNATWNYDPNKQKWGYQIRYSGGGDADETKTTWRYADDWQPGGGSTIDEAGLNAEIQKRLAEQQAASGGTSGDAQQSINDILTSDPGYQFRLDQGQQALDRQQAARGTLLSGRAMKDSADYNSGMASQEYGNVFNRLAGIAGVGQQAVNQTSQLGQGYGNQMSGNIIQGGNARASGYLAQGQAGQQGFNNLLGAAGTAGGLYSLFGGGSALGGIAALSDRRLKTNIRRTGTHASGLPWYEFDYVWGEPSEGVMADEVLAVKPEAVIEGPNGYLMVNYGAL